MARGSASLVTGSAEFKGTILPADPNQSAYWKHCPPAAVAWLRAEQAARASSWDAAIAELSLPVRARPFTAQVRARRGYYRLKAGQLGPAEADLNLALGFTRNRTLLAEIWESLGAGPKVQVWYDIPERRPLVQVELWDGELRIEVEGSKAWLRGAGCNAEVGL
jgi:hypothetical protein